MMGGCRISQQLCDYNPRQIGSCSIKRCRSCFDRAALPPRRFRFSSTRLLGFKLLGFNASSPPSSVASDDDLARLSFIANDASRPPCFSTCFS
ncbi:hypothetical protein OROGR_001562 [Orobanche gracilis]